MQGVRVGLIHGDVADDERRRLRAAFAAPTKQPEAIDVLLTSEVGSEGLDFQFCDALVNYDIPWNPMRIEQRIGRIDRYGQASETVAIYNFVTPGTVDFDIYDRCLLRIGIFERAIGGSEAILGEIAQRPCSSTAEDPTRPHRRRRQQRRLQQIRRQSKSGEIAGGQKRWRSVEANGIPASAWPSLGSPTTSRRLRASGWNPAGIERLVSRHLERTLGLGRSPVSGQGPAKTLRLSVEARRRLLPPRRPGSATFPCRAGMGELPEGRPGPTLGLTFDREAALADPSAQPSSRQCTRWLSAAAPRSSEARTTSRWRAGVGQRLPRLELTRSRSTSGSSPDYRRRTRCWYPSWRTTALRATLRLILAELADDPG